jgi:hypothetical protein
MRAEPVEASMRVERVEAFHKLRSHAGRAQAHRYARNVWLG